MSAEVWTLNPITMVVKGDKDRYSSEEFQNAVKPPCPVCGDPLQVNAHWVETFRDPGYYVIGMIDCANGCDLRAAKTKARQAALAVRLDEITKPE